MGASTERAEQTIASEQYKPALNERYSALFSELVDRLQRILPNNRVTAISDEIERVARIADEAESLDGKKYMAALSVLIDLSQQGWIFDVQNGELTLKMENSNIDEKGKIRYRLSAERNAQFKSPSVSKFIQHMETTRKYKGTQISIRNLIGDKNKLIEAIQGNQRVCDPYIQLVNREERDEFTGYKLCDIWRYFRYTWSIPYKTMPGRNLFYLVRDRLQPCHPVIGIFALGNSVLNLTVRDDDIGWTVEAIRKAMQQRTSTAYCDQILSGTEGKTIKVKISEPLESMEEYQDRREKYANAVFPLLIANIDTAISELYIDDLPYDIKEQNPRQEQIDELKALAEKYAKISIDNKNNEKNPDWKTEARSNLFIRKRANELAKLLSTKVVFNNAAGENTTDKLESLLSTEKGRKAIHTALIANRKRKIGSNMMEVVVCGSIPPYNELLGGKLVSMLACSPRVISDYTHKYENQISEIASRMKGEKVIRDSHLAYLGTTSLYAVGSSQYNRIKAPLADAQPIEYRRIGVTEGYGTVFFSKSTTSLFSSILEQQDGGKRINHVFGEGTSPRFRMISRGLSSIGIRAEAFLRHYSPRIVYSIDLAKNTKEFLMGYTDHVDYGYDLENYELVEQKTQELIDYWYQRWLTTRLTSVNIVERLEAFNINRFMLGNM